MSQTFKGKVHYAHTAVAKVVFRYLYSLEPLLQAVLEVVKCLGERPDSSVMKATKNDE
jgi:hypothetical protein